MACCGNDKAMNQTAIVNRLIFKRDELLMDIENYAFVTGDIINDEMSHIKHQVIDIAQGGNEELAARVLNLAHAECVEMLYPYTKMACIQDEVHDDELTKPEMYEIELRLPQQFSRTTVLLLRGLIHDYFVCRVLVEWMGVTYPDAQVWWRDRLEIIKNRMRGALLGRRVPVRRAQSLF